MRAYISYGIAGVIVLGVGAWLATGVFVAGGNGPGQGERPIVELVSRDTAALAPEQQALSDAAAAKAKEAADAKLKAEEAAKAAAKAQSEFGTATTKELEEHLAKEAELKAKEAAEAKAKAEELAAEAKKAEEEAERVRAELNSTRSIAERQVGSNGQEKPAPSVRTVTYIVKPMAIEVPLRGKTKAKASVSVMPQTSGTVQEVFVQKGQTVAAGDTLCQLDKGDREAAVAGAEAAVAQAQTGVDSNNALREKGLAAANSGLALNVALRQATVTLDNARTELRRTTIKASVPGIVQDPLASVGSMAGPTTPCATIVQLDPMLFKGQVPESRIAYAKLGLPAKVTTVTGQTVEGKVTYIGSMADDATRSFPIEIELPNPDSKVLDGITASATVNVGTAPAHLLPQSVLTLDDEGVLGIRAVQDSKVAFYPVTILQDTREGVWVTGLPPKVDVITVGQEFVQAGQSVIATNVTAAQAAEEANAEGVQS